MTSSGRGVMRRASWPKTETDGAPCCRRDDNFKKPSESPILLADPDSPTIMTVRRRRRRAALDP